MRTRASDEKWELSIVWRWKSEVRGPHWDWQLRVDGNAQGRQRPGCNSSHPFLPPHSTSQLPEFTQISYIPSSWYAPYHMHTLIVNQRRSLKGRERQSTWSSHAFGGIRGIRLLHHLGYLAGENNSLQPVRLCSPKSYTRCAYRSPSSHHHIPYKTSSRRENGPYGYPLSSLSSVCPL